MIRTYNTIRPPVRTIDQMLRCCGLRFFVFGHILGVLTHLALTKWTSTDIAAANASADRGINGYTHKRSQNRAASLVEDDPPRHRGKRRKSVLQTDFLPGCTTQRTVL